MDLCFVESLLFHFISVPDVKFLIFFVFEVFVLVFGHSINNYRRFYLVAIASCTMQFLLNLKINFNWFKNSQLFIRCTCPEMMLLAVTVVVLYYICMKLN